jgi:hypothetical protein
MRLKRIKQTLKKLEPGAKRTGRKIIKKAKAKTQDKMRVK